MRGLDGNAVARACSDRYRCRRGTNMKEADYPGREQIAQRQGVAQGMWSPLRVLGARQLSSSGEKLVRGDAGGRHGRRAGSWRCRRGRSAGRAAKTRLMRG
jgi:hypothetical protein